MIRSKDEAFHKDYLKRTVKFPAIVMVWGCMSANGVDNLHIISGSVNAQKYQEIFEENLLASVEKFNMA